MKIKHLILFFAVVLSILFSCKKTSYHKLSITLDSTFKYRLNESITLTSENYSSTIDTYDSTCWSYDTIKGELTFLWDSLSDDEYNFCFKTIFTKEQNLKFELLSDSTFYLKNNLGIENVDIIDLNDLINTDTIEFAYKSNGCFVKYIEKSILVKKQTSNNYILKTYDDSFNDGNLNSSTYPNVHSDIIDTIFQVELESKRREKNREYRFYLTQIQTFYMLVNNKLFVFNDPWIEKQDLYNKIKNEFIN